MQVYGFQELDAYKFQGNTNDQQRLQNTQNDMY